MNRRQRRAAKAGKNPIVTPGEHIDKLGPKDEALIFLANGSVVIRAAQHEAGDPMSPNMQILAGVALMLTGDSDRATKFAVEMITLTQQAALEDGLGGMIKADAGKPEEGATS